jgi:GAF domain-containing protein
MPADLEVLTRLCDHAAVALDAAGAAFCRVRATRDLEFVAASDDAAAALGRVEVASRQGPGVHASRSGSVVAVDDVTTSTAWPQFARAASRHGVSASAALPVIVDGSTVAVIDVYRRRAGCWSRHDLEVGGTVTEMARILVSCTSDLARAAAMIEQLQGALEHRAVIEQAKGMIARDHHVSVEAAFEMLRRHSRNSNTPVRVLARAVTELGVQIPVPADGRALSRPSRIGPLPVRAPLLASSGPDSPMRC